ncbi:hypothetical protein AgCh_009214 [Apium graveolens]
MVIFPCACPPFLRGRALASGELPPIGLVAPICLGDSCAVVRAEFQLPSCQAPLRVEAVTLGIRATELKQGGKSVLEFEAKFTELARLVPENVSTESQEARRFQKGLKPEIRRGVVALQLETYSSMVQVALVMEGDQKLVVKEENDKKRKSGGVRDKENQEESSQVL